MLYQLFVQIVNMSITASVVIVAVLFARAFMRRLPKKYSYVLWGIIAIRLLCPVGIASPVSVFNLVGEYTVIDSEEHDNAWMKNGIVQNKSVDTNGNTDFEKVNQNDGVKGLKKVESGANNGTGMQTEKLGQGQTVDSQLREYETTFMAKARNSFVKYGTVVWISVGGVLFLWNLFLLLKMKRRIARAVRLRENIYECDNIPSPFVMGIVRSKIYIPFRLGECEQEYIIKHEQYHIFRKDNVFKLIAVLLTCIYWFHPLVWVSYVLMIRDMEMSCDEYVLQKSSQDIRENYSRSLLGFAMNQRNMGFGLQAFGESDTRKRVKNIMKHKKCGKWIGIIAVCLIMIVGVACLTDAEKTRSEKQIDGNENVKKARSEKQTNGNENTKLLATAQIHDFQVNILYVSDERIEEHPKSGYYEGDSFVIQTSKDDAIVDRHALSLGTPEDGTMYFPSEGFELSIKDYDGNGDKDDFALGQGQTMIPEFGNFMKYAFFGVNENGTIVEYHTSTEDGLHIVTVPGEYSPSFTRKNGELIFCGLGEKGVKEMSTSIVRYLSVDEIVETKQEPEYSLMNAIESTMPDDVVTELQKNGVWHVSIGADEEGEQQKYYNLANSTENDKVILRLDFTFDKTGNMIQYVSKDYGFVENLTEEEGDTEPFSSVISFAEKFLGMKLVQIMIETKEGSIYNGLSLPADIVPVWKEETPERWKDGNHACFRDSFNNYYVVELRQGMVVYFQTDLTMEQEASSAVSGN